MDYRLKLLTWPAQLCMNHPNNTLPCQLTNPSSHSVLQRLSVLEDTFSYDFLLWATLSRRYFFTFFLKSNVFREVLRQWTGLIEISSSYSTPCSTKYPLGGSYNTVIFTPCGTNWAPMTSDSPPLLPQGHRQWLLCSLLCFQCPPPSSTHSWCSLCVEGLNNEDFECKPRM